MLRELFHHIKQAFNQSTTMHTGEVGFKLSNGRLPWSTLKGDLQKKGFMIVNWPQGVVCDRDKGISGLSAEDADELHDALFVDEHRLRFVPSSEESTYNNDGVASVAVASGSERPPESDRSAASKQPKFTTAEAYAGHPHRNKRRVCSCAFTPYHSLTRDYDFHGHAGRRFPTYPPHDVQDEMNCTRV
ncbi:hypothetical protein OG21DRAFT_142893 [Imleria badia]|nr:hypothetical protein OG21DRAFT_142893 [Imleria badia]